MSTHVRWHLRSGRPVRAHTRRGPGGGGSVLGVLGAALLIVVGIRYLGADDVLDLDVVPGAATSTTVSVARIIDGDTLTYREDGREVRVRILGYDAPETTGQTCGDAAAATAALTELVDGRQVTLTTDPGQKDRDDNNRLLRYVDVGETDVSRAMIRDGYAPATSRAGEHARHDTYAWAQQAAQRESAPYWRACG